MVLDLIRVSCIGIALIASPFWRNLFFIMHIKIKVLRPKRRPVPSALAFRTVNGTSAHVLFRRRKYATTTGPLGKLVEARLVFCPKHSRRLELALQVRRIIVPWVNPSWGTPALHQSVPGGKTLDNIFVSHTHWAGGRPTKWGPRARLSVKVVFVSHASFYSAKLRSNMCTPHCPMPRCYIDHCR